MRAAVLALVLLQLAACDRSATANGDAMSDVIVYYLSFGVDTFVPVTRDLIEEQADCRFVLRRDGEDARGLKSLLEQWVDGDFDDRVVRVKVVGLSTDPYFVDVDGGVLSGPREMKLREPAFEALRSLLELLARRESCDG